ncbi:MAG: aminodeoxychorismate synthase component I [Nitrospinae bacterium CG11_big_fil_rev_8_21_14_0_20_56_8]|nr:MAG: aminodeoxychorismate synthase component I [Nitrospinae bacterium CG11_big_fil_rev_8_21_14_0_20_56_8]
MEILPSRDLFNRLAGTASRVPLVGQETAPNLDPALLFQWMYADSPHAFLLESGKGPGIAARYSFLGAAGSRILQTRGNDTLLTEQGVKRHFPGRPFEALTLMENSRSIPPMEHAPHFWGGWVGYIGYELGARFENLPFHPATGTDLYFMETGPLFVYDHETQVLKYIVACPIDGTGREFDRGKATIEAIWTRIAPALTRLTRPAERRVDPRIISMKDSLWNRLRPTLTRAEYLERVNRAKLYISEGDIYQANLAQGFEARYAGGDWNLYRRLQSVNPSPFSCLLRFGDLALVSSSPERLVKVTGDRIETRPIAGTRPRGQTGQEDLDLSRELLVNEKEKAEHLMLVDLERNDLGRICDPGTVRVTEFMTLEQYSHVSHIVSNIEGRLTRGTRLEEILRAVFPGGTITGCPKIRCMEIIHELEPAARGPYSGSAGYIGYDCTLDLNIIIRTILLHQGMASFHVGAGIVADSIPEKEYQETLDKAAALIQSLSSPEPGA